MRALRLILSSTTLIVAIAGTPAAAVGDAARQQRRSPPPKPAAAKPAPAKPAPATATPAPPGGGEWLDWQVRLDRAGFSPGEIDGRGGSNSRRALEAFARARNLSVDDHAALVSALGADGAEVTTTYTITEADTAGPFLPSIPTDLMEQASLPALSYTSALEMLAERAHASPALLKQLNPGRSFTAGEQIRVPNVGTMAPLGVKDTAAARGAATPPAAAAPPDVRVVVSKSGSGLTVYEGEKVVMFAPVTSGSEHDPLPIGKWEVTAVARNPTFNYNPDLFWDAEPGHAKAKIPPGPNGPVGTVWIDITREHYGLHGTPEPRNVGHTTSHGCVRLTNWDAEKLAALVKKGTVVLFEP